MSQIQVHLKILGLNENADLLDERNLHYVHNLVTELSRSHNYPGNGPSRFGTVFIIGCKLLHLKVTGRENSG